MVWANDLAPGFFDAITGAPASMLAQHRVDQRLIVPAADVVHLRA
jgi:hypothetical protein